MKTIVTISKKYNRPEIIQEIFKEGEDENGQYVRLSMPFDDFIVALKEEMGSVAMTITKEGLSKKIDSAISNITSAVRAEWTKHPY
jgi:hypothetical protein